jgi:hypothetical protein
MGWREDEEEEDRAASSSVGDGRAKTVEMAANAAIVLNPFILIYIFKKTYSSIKEIVCCGMRNGRRESVQRGKKWVGVKVSRE